jgi:hypothetical protein
MNEVARWRRGASLPLIATLVGLLAVTASAQRFEWRNVEQDVRILADGGVEVRDARTLWTDADFGEAFLCLHLQPGQRMTLLPGETGAISPGPPAIGLLQACDGGTEVVVRQEVRVSERRVRFAYRLDGVLEEIGDSVEWFWNVLEQDRPVVLGYRLRVVIPGPMAAPFDAYVTRYANWEPPRIAMAPDRSVLKVEFARVPPGEGVEIRYVMDPRLFRLSAAEP